MTQGLKSGRILTNFGEMWGNWPDLIFENQPIYVDYTGEIGKNRFRRPPFFSPVRILEHWLIHLAMTVSSTFSS
jgi:hypothetical protein